MYKFGDKVTCPDGRRAIYDEKATGVYLDYCYVMVEDEGSDMFYESDLTLGWQGEGKVVEAENTASCPFYDGPICSVINNSCQGIKSDLCPLPVTVRRK